MKAALLFAAVLLAAAPTDAQKWIEKHDPYNGSTLFAMSGIGTKMCKGDDGYQNWNDDVDVWLVAKRSKDGEIRYMLRVLLTATSRTSWAFLRSGDSMEALIDGRPKKFSAPIEGSREVLRGGVIQESILFDITRDDIRSVASSSFLQFRVEGSRRYIQKCMGAKQLKPFVEFLTKTEHLASVDGK